MLIERSLLAVIAVLAAAGCRHAEVGYRVPLTAWNGEPLVKTMTEVTRKAELRPGAKGKPADLTRYCEGVETPGKTTLVAPGLYAEIAGAVGPDLFLVRRLVQATYGSLLEAEARIRVYRPSDGSEVDTGCDHVVTHDSTNRRFVLEGDVVKKYGKGTILREYDFEGHMTAERPDARFFHKPCDGRILVKSGDTLEILGPGFKRAGSSVYCVEETALGNPAPGYVACKQLGKWLIYRTNDLEPVSVLHARPAAIDVATGKPPLEGAKRVFVESVAAGGSGSVLLLDVGKSVVATRINEVADVRHHPPRLVSFEKDHAYWIHELATLEKFAGPYPGPPDVFDAATCGPVTASTKRLLIRAVDRSRTGSVVLHEPGKGEVARADGVGDIVLHAPDLISFVKDGEYWLRRASTLEPYGGPYPGSPGLLDATTVGPRTPQSKRLLICAVSRTGPGALVLHDLASGEVARVNGVEHVEPRVLHFADKASRPYLELRSKTKVRFVDMDLRPLLPYELELDIPASGPVMVNQTSKSHVLPSGYTIILLPAPDEPGAWWMLDPDSLRPLPWLGEPMVVKPMYVTRGSTADVPGVVQDRDVGGWFIREHTPEGARWSLHGLDWSTIVPPTWLAVTDSQIKVDPGKWQRFAAAYLETEYKKIDVRVTTVKVAWLDSYAGMVEKDRWLCIGRKGESLFGGETFQDPHGARRTHFEDDEAEKALAMRKKVVEDSFLQLKDDHKFEKDASDRFKGFVAKGDFKSATAVCARLIAIKTPGWTDESRLNNLGRSNDQELRLWAYRWEWTLERAGATSDAAAHLAIVQHLLEPAIRDRLENGAGARLEVAEVHFILAANEAEETADISKLNPAQTNARIALAKARMARLDRALAGLAPSERARLQPRASKHDGSKGLARLTERGNAMAAAAKRAVEEERAAADRARYSGYCETRSYNTSGHSSSTGYAPGATTDWKFQQSQADFRAKQWTQISGMRTR